MTLPNFICIGAPKCGTTFLADVLGQLPGVCSPSCLGNKEVDFFTHRRNNYIKGLDWYKKNFSHCQPGQITGDFSPSYFSDPDSPKLIKENLPDVKIIAILRNPARRAFSSYLFDKRACRIAQSTSFHDAARTRHFYLDDSKFVVHIQQYFNVFASEKIHVMFLEDLQQYPNKQFAQLLHFLDLPTELPAHIDLTPSNQGASNRFSYLTTLLKQTKTTLGQLGFRWLSDLLVRTGVQDLFVTWNSLPSEQMPPSLYAELIDYFEDHDKRLCELLKIKQLPWQPNL